MCIKRYSYIKLFFTNKKNLFVYLYLLKVQTPSLTSIFPDLTSRQNIPKLGARTTKSISPYGFFICLARCKEWITVQSSVTGSFWNNSKISFSPLLFISSDIYGGISFDIMVLLSNILHRNYHLVFL